MLSKGKERKYFRKTRQKKKEKKKKFLTLNRNVKKTRRVQKKKPFCKTRPKKKRVEFLLAKQSI